MFDPLTLGVGALLFLAFKKQSGNTKFGAVTPEREELYQNCMAFCHDPQKLREHAKLFAREGLKAHALALEKRAEWRDRSPETKAVHADLFDRAMKSTNVPSILQVAALFQEATATQKAEQLRAHAQAVNEAALRAQMQPEPASPAAPEAAPVPEPKKTNGVHVPEVLPS